MIKPCTPLLPRCCCCCIYMLLLSIAFTTTSTTTAIQAHHPSAVVVPSPLSSTETSPTSSSSPSSTFDPSSKVQGYLSSYHSNDNNLGILKTLRKRVSREEKRLTADDCLSSTTSQLWDLPKQEDTTVNTNNNQLHHHHHHQRHQQRHQPILVSDLQGRWRCEYKVTIAVPDSRHVIQLNLTTFQTLADMRDFSAGNKKALQLKEKNKTTAYATSIININRNTHKISNNLTASTVDGKNSHRSNDPATSSTNTSDISKKISSTSDFPRNIGNDNSNADLNLPTENTKLSPPPSEQQTEDSDKLSPPHSTISSSSQLNNNNNNNNNNNTNTQNKYKTDRSSASTKDLENDAYDNVKENSELERNINNLDIAEHGIPAENTRHSGEYSTRGLNKAFERAACRENKLIIQEAGGQENSRDQPLVVCLTQEDSSTSTAAIGAPVSTLVYHYQSSIQLTIIWDPHSVSSHLSLGYRMLPLEAIPCSHWCGETKSLCLLKHQLCDGHSDCVDGSDEDLEKCAVSTSPEQSQASTHEDVSSHMVFIVASVTVFLVVLIVVPTALMLKCRSNQRQQRDSLLQQQQRTHSLSSEMYQSPSSSVQDSSVSSHQYDQRASLLQDQQQHQQHEYHQQQEPHLDGTLNQLHQHHHLSPQSHQQHSLPTSCLEDEETASSSIHFSSLPERSLLDTHNQQLHHHHHRHDHHHHHQQQQQLTYTDCLPHQTSSRENNNNKNLGTNRRLEKELRHQSYPHHIPISRDGEEGYLKYQRALRSSSNSILIQQQMFRPPPNKTVHDRSSPPPPYSPKPPGAKSLDSILPAKHCDSGGNFNTRNVPILQGGQSCDKRSNSCSSGSRSYHFDSSDKSSGNSRNSRRQQQASPPQAALRCHNNNYRPISIQQGQGQGQTCCPSRLIPLSGDSATNISLVPTTVGLAAAPPDYHQVASAFPPSIPPHISPSSGACVGCSSNSSSSQGSSGVDVNSRGCPLGSNNSASSFGHHHNVAAITPVVTANNVFSNNTGLCCDGCSNNPKGGEHIVMSHHNQQHQQQDALLQFATAGTSTTPISAMIPTPPFNSLSPASRGVDNYNTLNHQHSSCSSSLLPLSSKTVCDNNMAHHSSCASSSSSSPSSSNLSKNNVISSPPPYNPTNYPLTSSPSSYPSSHIAPPPSYNNTPLIPITTAHSGNTHHHQQQHQEQQQHGLPTMTPHPPPPPFSSDSCTNASSSCPPPINTTISPDCGTNVFVFTKSSPSVCPTPNNSVNVTPDISTSSPSSSLAPTNHPTFTNGSKNKETETYTSDSSPSSQNPGNASIALTDGSSVTGVSQQPQEYLPNTSIYSQQCNKNISSSNSNEQPGSITLSGDRFSVNTLCNNDNTNTALTTTSAVESASSAFGVIGTNQAVISSSSSLLPNTATSFISSSPQLQQQHDNSHHHQQHPHHAQQQSSHHHHHHLQPHRHHNLSTSSSTAQGSVDEAISKMSLSSLPSPSSPFSLSPLSSQDPSPTSPFSPPPLATSPSPSPQSPINKHKDNSISPPPTTTSNFIKLTEKENNIGNLNVFHHHHHHHHHPHYRHHNDNNNVHHCCKKAVESEHCYDFEAGKQLTSDKSSIDGTNLNFRPLDTNGNTATAAFVLPVACSSDVNVAGNAASKCDFDGSSNNNIHHPPHNTTKTTTTTPGFVVAGLDSDSHTGTASIAMAPGYVDNKFNFDKDDKLCDALPSCTSNDNNCNDVIISPSSSSSSSSSCICVNKSNERGDTDNNSHNDEDE